MRCFKNLIFVVFIVYPSMLKGQGLPWDEDAQTGWQIFEKKVIHKKLELLEIPIVFFQKYVSPQDGPVCRFKPTCSVYGRMALRKHGIFKGLFLTLDRLVRDNPWSLRLDDPVP